MKILHTSDIHLKEYNGNRWKALLQLLEIGKKEVIDIFVISGDLFDKNIHAEELRPILRTIFSNNGFKIILIPGNHDKDSYKSGVYFGEDVTIIDDLNKPLIYNDVYIWGFPFEPIDGEVIINKLHQIREKLPQDKTNILLYHGELIDAFFSRNDFGDEGDKRYMPVKLSYFRDLNINYILAGHIHSRFEVWQIDSGKYFIYPGSPIAITKREIGVRKVNLFSVGEPPKEYILNTPHYIEIIIEFDPINDLNPLEIIKKKFEHINPNAQACLKIKGFLNCNAIGTSEEELIAEIKKIVIGKCIEEIYEVQDISIIIEDELFTKFTKKLKEKQFDPVRVKKMQELTIKSMMRMR